MADSGLNHLNQNPYDANTANLVKQLFLPKDNGQNVNDRPRMEKVRSIFRSIRHMRTEVFGDASAMDVVCLPFYRNEAPFETMLSQNRSSIATTRAGRRPTSATSGAGHCLRTRVSDLSRITSLQIYVKC